MKTMCVTGRSTRSDADYDRLLAGFGAFPPDYFEVRDKAATDRRVLELLRRAVEALGGPRVLANSRFDLALAAGAGGVVLPDEGLPVEPVRRETPRGFVVGKSTHSPEAARNAAEAGADLVLLGPIFDTPSKREFGPPLAPAAIPETGDSWPASASLFVIGGIDLRRLDALAPFRARIAGFAGIRAFEDAADPGAVVREARDR
ncbi:MAG TPA: thiamine phosphate synthase [Thermoanaerobaculia bacterium]|jgi:thiamine-phosphate pyrophosphorylase|nr:thiamine phosphate synthase [Thermoanaerobaculia bacterium]